MGEKEGFGEIGWEADRTEEKKSACSMSRQKAKQWQPSKNFHSKHTESIEFFIKIELFYIKKVAKMTTFRLVIYIFSMTNR